MDIWLWVVILLAAALIALVIVGSVRGRNRVDPTSVSLDPALVSKVRALYAKGDKLAAVKALREATGIGLADAVRIVDKLGASGKPKPAAGPAATGDLGAIQAGIGPDHVDQLRVLMAGGRQIEAIKMVRTLTGMGLKDAKDYVERL